MSLQPPIHQSSGLTGAASLQFGQTGAARQLLASLAMVRPPYEQPDAPATGRVLQLAHSVPGAVVGIRVAEARIDWVVLEAVVRMLRVQLPSTPVVLIFEAPVRDSFLISCRATRLHVRAVLVEGTPFAPVLKQALTETTWLADEVVEWLELQGARMSPSVRHLLGRIFAEAVRHRDVTHLLRESGTAESTARFQLHKRMLPAPGKWFQAARALHAALRIQAEPSTCLMRMAFELGYADHSALSQLVHRAFKVRPGAVRNTLGWEWLMSRWLDSCSGNRRWRRVIPPPTN